MSDSFDLRAPELFTTGTVGPPGQRVFYLQVRESGTLVTLKVEKEQVAGLAEYFARILGRLPAAAGLDPGDLVLREPIEPRWAVASLGAGYDEAADRIVVVAEELVEEDAGGEPAKALFSLSRAQVTAFVERARALMKAGRPPCPICSQPRDPEGHVCSRSNGHMPH